MRRIKLATLLVVVLALLGLVACGGSDDEKSSDSGSGASPSADAADTGECKPKHPGLKTVKEGELTVALYESPPFATVKDGKLAGGEGELLNRIAEMECLKATPQNGQAAAVVPSITSGRADTGIGSWYRTAERDKIVLLGAPVMKDQMAIVSKEDAKIETVQALKGKKVGAVLGYLWVDDLKKLLGDDLKLYPSADGSYRDLAAGRIDAAIDGVSVVQLQLKKTPVPGAFSLAAPPDDAVKASTQPGQPQWAVNKSNPELRKALDEDLEELRASGELEKILVENGFPAELADPGPPNLL
jgi:polar amino acid transport system substrate-binding protein